MDQRVDGISSDSFAHANADHHMKAGGQRPPVEFRHGLANSVANLDGRCSFGTVKQNDEFVACQPRGKVITDITEFRIPAGKIYLSPMIDCFDGMVVSWSIGTRPDADLVNTMLDAAIETVTASNDWPVVHSDRGAHDRWRGWLSGIADAKLVRSMSRKGYSPDAAACEGFFGRLKNELFYPRDWMSTTHEEFVEALHSYIRWYNEKRIKFSLVFRSPVEHRQSLGILV